MLHRTTLRPEDDHQTIAGRFANAAAIWQRRFEITEAVMREALPTISADQAIVREAGTSSPSTDTESDHH